MSSWLFLFTTNLTFVSSFHFHFPLMCPIWCEQLLKNVFRPHEVTGQDITAASKKIQQNSWFSVNVIRWQMFGVPFDRRWFHCILITPHFRTFWYNWGLCYLNKIESKSWIVSSRAQANPLFGLDLVIVTHLRLEASCIHIFFPGKWCPCSHSAAFLC